MYIIKIKGVAKIPDYIQVRDQKFTLVGYFRADRPEKGIEQLGLADRMEEIIALIQNLPFNTLRKFL